MCSFHPGWGLGTILHGHGPAQQREDGKFSVSLPGHIQPKDVFYWTHTLLQFLKIRELHSEMRRFHIKMLTSGFSGKMENANTESFLIPIRNIPITVGSGF